jgi:SAM-dependent methyltransferase
MTALPAETQKLLRCPHCLSELRFADNAHRCGSCGGVYPLTPGGVPVLIDESKSVFDIADFLREKETFFRKRGFLFTAIRAMLPEISRNYHTAENYARLRDELLRRGNARVLIVGGSILGKDMEALLTPGIELVETDIALGPRTQLIVDAHSIPFADGSFDAVIAQAVLEHVADPIACVAEFHRVLKADGFVYAETPFMQQVHGGAYDFTRFTHLGYLRLFRNFEELASGAVAGAGTVLAWSFEYFLISFSGRSRPLRNTFSGLSRLLTFWLKYLDAAVIDTPPTLDGASGFYFFGRRSERTVSDRELIKKYRGAL